MLEKLNLYLLLLPFIGWCVYMFFHLFEAVLCTVHNCIIDDIVDDKILMIICLFILSRDHNFRGRNVALTLIR